MRIGRVMRGSTSRSRGTALWATKNAVYVLVIAGVLLGVSGSPAWVAAWAYLAFLTVYLTMLGVLLRRHSPDLLAERSGVQEGAEAWDVPLASLSAVWLPLGIYVVAALGERLGWSPPVGAAAVVVGVALLLVGAALSTWAVVVNDWFSAVVRLQTDRGQVVVTSGPYRIVRHPGYLGSILIYTGVALALGSVWALGVVVALVGVLVVRTAREDRLLREHLSGYREYAARVRSRLVPGLW